MKVVFLPLLLALLGCAKPASISVELARPVIESAGPVEIIWDTPSAPCFEDKHGIKVRSSFGTPCPDQLDFETAIDEVYDDARIVQSAATALSGMTITYDDRIIDIPGGFYAEGLALGDFWLIVSSSKYASDPRTTLKHEVLHAVRWKFKRVVGHDDPRFKKYDEGG